MYIQDDLKECLKLQFRDITYKVIESQTDGQGGSKLFLHKI